MIDPLVDTLFLILELECIFQLCDVHLVLWTFMCAVTLSIENEPWLKVRNILLRLIKIE